MYLSEIMKRNILQNYFLKIRLSIRMKLILRLTMKKKIETEQLFDQDINEDEDFEIPAFLRKQKF